MQVDAIVVGGGMVGAACAALLADEGLSVLVLEAAAAIPVPQQAAAGVDEVEPRVSALTLATQQLLVSLDAWRHIAAPRCEAYTRMQVWDADGTGSLTFDCADTGTPALGWIVENAQVAAALRAACAQRRGITWRDGARVAGMDRRHGRWEVALAGGDTVSAPLLVGADGAQSQVREQLGIRLDTRDYQHHAIVSTVRTAQPHGHCARQRFLDEGPLAFLPLAGGDGHFCSVVWSVPPARAQELLALDDAAFAARLADAFEQRLGEVCAVSRRAAFPLVGRHARQYVHEGAVLVGDAAHTVHPLAGQGVNLGFLDAATLAEEVGRSLARGLPATEPLGLRRYERRRRLHNTLMQQSFAGLKALFGARALPVRWLRNTGLSLVDQVLPAKVLFARQAMGLDGDIPARCRPAPRGADLLA